MKLTRRGLVGLLLASPLAALLPKANADAAVVSEPVKAAEPVQAAERELFGNLSGKTYTHKTYPLGLRVTPTEWDDDLHGYHEQLAQGLAFGRRRAQSVEAMLLFNTPTPPQRKPAAGRGRDDPAKRRPRSRRR